MVMQKKTNALSKFSTKLVLVFSIAVFWTGVSLGSVFGQVEEKPKDSTSDQTQEKDATSKIQISKKKLQIPKLPTPLKSQAAGQTQFQKSGKGGTHADYADHALLADRALKADHAKNADNAINGQNAQNAKNADNAQNHDHPANDQNAQNAKNAENAKNADNAKNAQNAVEAQHAAQGVEMQPETLQLDILMDATDALEAQEMHEKMEKVHCDD